MTQSNTTYDPNSSTAAFDYLKIQPGHRLTLANGARAEVTGNPGDGCWLLIRYIEHPDNPEAVGQEDMVFFTDVTGAETE